MSDRVALVTGGASGIGRAAAVAFAADGADVVIADVDVGGGEKTAELVAGHGREALVVNTDVADSASVEAAVAQTLERFGRLDSAANAAGIQGVFNDIDAYPEDVYAKLVAVNMTGVWLSMKYEARAMLESGGGAIVNVASNFGLVGGPGHSAYAASKHGVVGMTKSVALEYAQRGIRVNAICPGGTVTPMFDKAAAIDPEGTAKMSESVLADHPMGRWAQPEEMGAAIVWMCSDGASYLSGAIVPVDGGFVAH